MDNYNPRQPTRFRFKDSREIEKFLFLCGGFSFNDETLENVSKDSLYSRIIEQLKENSKIGFSTPIILYDTENTQLFTGSIFEDLTVHLYANIGGSIAIVDMEYNTENDTLKITYTSEGFISEDNVKTLFGNQSIIGTGNIDLYRHQISFTGQGSFECGAVIYSSKNLKIDSIQDLNSVTKATAGYGIPIVAYETSSTSQANTYGLFDILYFDGTNWYVGKYRESSIDGKWLLSGGESDKYLVTSINDIVTTI